MKTDKTITSEKISDLSDNSALKRNPQIWRLWDFDLNENLNIESITFGTRKRAYFICENCLCSEEGAIKTKKTTTCKKCTISISNSNRIDYLYLSRPDIYMLMVDKDLGKSVYKSSKIYTDFKCPNCDIINKKIRISTVVNDGFHCNNCTDNFSYGEKIMYNILHYLNIDFKREAVFEWSSNKRYDFYLPTENTIIEMHGIQHYKPNKFGMDNEDFIKNIENDEFKKSNALINGIDTYIIIDCRKSNFDFIYNNIINSELAISNLINSDELKELIVSKSTSSVKLDSLKLWNDGLKVKEISDKLNIGTRTVSRYLKEFEELGKCEYDPYRGNKNKKMKTISKINDNNEIVYTYINYLELKKDYYNIGSISEAIKNNKKHKGFYWNYN